MTFSAYVDRIEGEFAIVEVNGVHMDWPLTALPEGINEGTTITISVEMTESSMRQEAEERLQRLQATSAKQTKFKI